ncbi:MAG: asparaginase [Pseudomonadota bacterium]
MTHAVHDALTVTYDRDGTPDSVHQVAAVVAQHDQVMAQWGTGPDHVFSSDAFHPFWALALVASGAADAFDLQEHQLALALSSHSGEPRHQKAITHWLDHLDLSEADLRCAAQPPRWHQAMVDLYREGEAPSAKHHAYSGAHTAMLTLMAHLNATGDDKAPGDYREYDHPVQRYGRDVAQPFWVEDLSAPTWAPDATAPDGTGVPSYAIGLKTLAQAYARFVSPPAGQATACEAVCHAWGSRPDLVAGSDCFDTAVMLATEGRVLSKSGVEGVQMAVITDQKLGLAVKVMDGAQRAAEQAMAALLVKHGALDKDDDELHKHWPSANHHRLHQQDSPVGGVTVTGL